MDHPAHLYLRANQGSDRYVLSEVFEWNSYGVDLERPLRIMDLGANAGFASVYFGLRWPGVEIVAVEPMPENASSVRKNFDLNALRGKVVEAAIGTEDGMLTIRRGAQAALNRVEEAPSGEGDFVQVQSRSVVSLLDEMAWSRIDLMKMDIEGYEATLLRKNNEWLNRVDALCLEIHGDFGEADLRGLAREFGFQLSQLSATTWLLKQ
jgi:FkbM family methyltransferase